MINARSSDLLSLVRLQTELDSTQSYYHYLSPIWVFEISLKVARNDVKRQLNLKDVVKDMSKTSSDKKVKRAVVSV